MQEMHKKDDYFLQKTPITIIRLKTIVPVH